MNNKILAIGFIILGLGIIVCLVGAALTGSNARPYTNLTSIGSGEWESGVLNFTNTSAVIVYMTAGTNLSLVNASAISTVNRTDVARYAVAPNFTLSSNGTTERLYSAPEAKPGAYNLVYFGSALPAFFEYIYSPNFRTSTVETAVLLLPVGILLIVIGAITALVGYFKRRAVPPLEPSPPAARGKKVST